VGKITNHKKSKGSTELHQKIARMAEVILSTKHSRVWANNTGAIKLKDCHLCGTTERFIKFGLPGSSDIIGIYKGLFLAVEVKTGDGFQSKVQKKFEKMVCNMGGIYVLIRETNVEQLLNMVEKKYQERIGES